MRLFLEGADLLRYTVTLENKTGSEISGVAVAFTHSIFLSKPVSIGTLLANGSETVGLSHQVSNFVEAESCAFGDVCPLPETAQVLVNNVLVTQTEGSTPLMPIPACGFAYDLNDSYGSDQVLVSDMYIWTLPEDVGIAKTGVWEILLRPTLPDNTRQPLDARVDVRDGVPGNWCTLAIGTPSGFSDRWKSPYPPDPTVTGEVYLPGAEDYSGLGLDDGVCLGGGVGGDYFEVGNPKSFCLRADGNVTVKWTSATP
jgi:hypothetical protein